MQDQSIIFGPYRIDTENQQLWCGERVVTLQPKPWAVLQYLAQRPGRVISSKELLKTVWAGTVVTKAVVKECMRAIREALEEAASTPQYIETVGREGYRFIGVVVGNPPVVASGFPSPSTFSPPPRLSSVVGRERELERLQTALQKALNGERQLVFVTGEPGIGKTTVLDIFREQVQATESILSGYGQCIEQYGGGEAYLPILEALGRMCRAANGQQILGLLRTYAPTWLVQLPGVLNETEGQILRLQAQGATQQRMLRELAEAIEVGTTRRLLVLMVEDLHWSDQATVELLAYLAQRREPARLLMIGTYRPAELVLGNHPLKAVKQELSAKHQCEEVRLELLSKHEVNEYLHRRFPLSQFPSDLPEEIHRRTDGNALFMVTVVEELLAQGVIEAEAGQWKLTGNLMQVSVPDTLRQLIEKQVQQRSEAEQRLLEVASVVGREFAVAVVATAMKQEFEEVEEICEALAGQGHFLEEQGIAEWPDGTVTGRYAFRHTLYQNVLYDRIAAARRVRLHRLIGEQIEVAYGERIQEIAAELAVHFEQGRDSQRAILYLDHAGKNAIQRSAYREAILHFTKGLDLLKTLPDTLARAQQELSLQVAFGMSLMVTKGYAAPDVEQAYERARTLCQNLGPTPQLFPVLIGLHSFYLGRGDLQKAYEYAEQCIRLADSVHDPALLLEGHTYMGESLYFLGDLVTARDHFKTVSTLYDPQHHYDHALLYGTDPGVMAASLESWTLHALGYPEQALRKSQEAVALAKKLAHAHSLAYALTYAAGLYGQRREGEAAQGQADAILSLASKQGLFLWLALGTVDRGWALAEQGLYDEGIAVMRQGLVGYQTIGARLGSSGIFLTLAEAYGKAGQAEEGQRMLDEGIATSVTNGEQVWEAELWRVKGELLLQQFQVARSKFQIPPNPQLLPPDPQAEAEECFLKAIAIARQQQTKSWELRATRSLARLWRSQGKQSKAHQRLSEIYDWFTEGFDTRDLQEAKGLLEELVQRK